MEYFIDGKNASERTFWSVLDVLASVSQKRMILDGKKVRIAESVYWIEPKRG